MTDNERLAQTKQELETAKHQLSQAKHRLEEAEARDRVQERKARTRRLIQEGAILEKVFPQVREISINDLENFLRDKFA